MGFQSTQGTQAMCGMHTGYVWYDVEKVHSEIIPGNMLESKLIKHFKTSI